jgi:hypothetical protein|mmetsp:Transcript_1039/g.2707  ORF Transcript_1039/g.2707 Transcript_1039/m.2707 type:complete len:185 (-) Transcript_1039:27-581(-)
MCRPTSSLIRNVSHPLSLLLQRTRMSILMLLLVVLPLHSVVQFVAGIQGPRHLHAAAVRGEPHSVSMLATRVLQPLHHVLDRLHAAQEPRLAVNQHLWGISQGPAAGLHQHDGVYHRHGAETHDVVGVGEPSDDAVQLAATAFLAWIPSALMPPAAGESADHPDAAALAWRDRVVAPPLTPPRG